MAGSKIQPELHRTAVPKDLVIGLERTMCPGACPDYSLFIHGDGRVVYEGRHYVAVKGRRKTSVSKASVKRLFDEFYRTDFYLLKDRYDPVASDGAITKTSIRADGRKKEVVNCHPSQAPEELYQLEQMIDEIAWSVRWIRDKSGKPALKP
jgi:hypothetical protein